MHKLVPSRSFLHYLRYSLDQCPQQTRSLVSKNKSATSKNLEFLLGGAAHQSASSPLPQSTSDSAGKSAMTDLRRDKDVILELPKRESLSQSSIDALISFLHHTQIQPLGCLSDISMLSNPKVAWLSRLLRIVEECRANTPGSFVELKKTLELGLAHRFVGKDKGDSLVLCWLASAANDAHQWSLVLYIFDIAKMINVQEPQLAAQAIEAAYHCGLHGRCESMFAAFSHYDFPLQTWHVLLKSFFAQRNLVYAKEFYWQMHRAGMANSESTFIFIDGIFRVARNHRELEDIYWKLEKNKQLTAKVASRILIYLHMLNKPLFELLSRHFKTGSISREILPAAALSSVLTDPYELATLDLFLAICEKDSQKIKLIMESSPSILNPAKSSMLRYFAAQVCDTFQLAIAHFGFKNDLSGVMYTLQEMDALNLTKEATSAKFLETILEAFVNCNVDIERLIDATASVKPSLDILHILHSAFVKWFPDNASRFDREFSEMATLAGPGVVFDRCKPVEFRTGRVLTATLLESEYKKGIFPRSQDVEREVFRMSRRNDILGCQSLLKLAAEAGINVRLSQKLVNLQLELELGDDQCDRELAQIAKLSGNDAPLAFRVELAHIMINRRLFANVIDLLNIQPVLNHNAESLRCLFSCFRKTGQVSQVLQILKQVVHEHPKIPNLCGNRGLMRELRICISTARNSDQNEIATQMMNQVMMLTYNNKVQMERCDKALAKLQAIVENW